MTNLDAVLTDLESPHRGGHHCTAADGFWVSHRDQCPAIGHVATIRATVDDLTTRVHAAAHNPEAVDAVATGMLAGTPLSDLHPEQAEGWRHLTRLAIEALAHHLDGQV